MAAVWVTTRGRGRRWQGFALELPFPPRLQTVNDKRKRVLVISRIQRRSYQASFLLLVGFEMKKMVERGIGP
jgi:hypothetical protein